ncbi:MAG: CDP-diacylglycerol--glycerol-3-phosphate 3-phosphatidyltransferase [Tissierellia bacterium]|jgi:CDP-diacylglycerol--glycerol-3-phosphate 3-phosphatidyltransferase|nr:CDP-diacylglycerol--glycerol-3-phosphate 3-phosphatidyltransferase [Bacillota bacterium]NLK59271.1 CDP-diacylglycerol--glycerol-3-phosphate 3-phosphatidyltransferase [Tissierellia bacterium]
MNLANKLTIARVLLIPVFILVYYTSGVGFWAALVFGIATITDTLDGYIARSRKLITTFGKFADPLADKILVTSALILLVGSRIIPAWAVILIIAREFIVTGFRILAASERITIAASPLGKLKTITQFVAILLLLLGNPFFGSFPMDLLMFYLSVLLTIVSGADYLLRNKQVLDLSNL